MKTENRNKLEIGNAQISFFGHSSSSRARATNAVVRIAALYRAVEQRVELEDGHRRSDAAARSPLRLVPGQLARRHNRTVDVGHLAQRRVALGLARSMEARAARAGRHHAPLRLFVLRVHLRCGWWRSAYDLSRSALPAAPACSPTHDVVLIPRLAWG